MTGWRHDFGRAAEGLRLIVKKDNRRAYLTADESDWAQLLLERFEELANGRQTARR